MICTLFESLIIMLIPDLTQPFWFIVIMIALFSVIVGRYFLVSGLFYLVFYRWFPARWKERKIGQKNYTGSQLRREVSWSMVTATIYAVVGTVTMLLWQRGFTKIYTDIDQYSLWWLPVSLIASMLIAETYYYWVHRWLHLPRVFKLIHKVHHQSKITSPWTAFAFHPLEGIILSLALPITMMIVPLHPVVILVELSVMTLSSVINHLDIELYPKKFHLHPIGKWIIGATHHGLHHKNPKYNLGLYFTFWDKFKKTESPIFNATFEKITEKQP